jgi:alpha-amylase/alpha-mannosidase (GH57 family)
MERYVCIHCHFYQPPRENPWLEAIEQQDSAYPYHDWNERITAECYAPNSASRILTGSGKITQIVNNYSNISFNFGPTLLSWMEDRVPEIYARILDADREGAERFSGHGPAIAQVYNHMILPLANRRDRETQVKWGIRDFEHRFGRAPEGMWLSETAADTETLEVLAEHGIKFTILAPNQGKHVRKIGGGGRWRNVEGGRIDPTQAYACRLPSGREITVFFYDGPISRAVAFEGLLSDGKRFADRILGGFNDARKWPQIMHIATDGETYGHHHRHGDMALAYALDHMANNGGVKITIYGEYLEKHPPTHEAEIVDNTSWSCAHGVERWKSNCGCNSGMKPGWSQEWRAPLRAALDQTRDSLSAPYEEKARELLKDPWAARDEYINVVLDRSARSLDQFFLKHQSRELNEGERVLALKLLELQRHAMLMYTSCGWFFDELSGIETVQVIQYAARSLQLAEDLFGREFEKPFLERLAESQSNVPECGNGAKIYDRSVKPSEVDLLKVGAHYAISSLFERYAEQDSIYCYEVDRIESHRQTSGRAQLATGRAEIQSRITREKSEVSYGVLHFGDHNLNAGVRHFRGEEAFRALVKETSDAFAAADLPGAVRVLDRNFEGITYSLKSLFKDEQRRVLREIMASTMAEAESSYTQIYEHHASLMAYLGETKMPLPNVLRITAEFVINRQLRHAFEEQDLELGRIADLLDTAKREDVPLDVPGLSYALKKRLEIMADELAVNPREETLVLFNAAMKLVRSLPFPVDLWKIQNVYYQLAETILPELQSRDDEQSRRWCEEFIRLGEQLEIQVSRIIQPAQSVA